MNGEKKIKQIIIKRCCQCPYVKYKSIKRPDDSGFHEVAYCTHLSFCEDEGSHMSCDTILICESNKYNTVINNCLLTIPDWCPLDNI